MPRKIFDTEEKSEKPIRIYCDKCGESGLVKESTYAKKRSTGIPCIHCGDGRMKPLPENPLKGITFH